MRSIKIIASVVMAIGFTSVLNAFVFRILVLDVLEIYETNIFVTALGVMLIALVPFGVGALLIKIYQKQAKQRIQRLKDRH